MVELRLSSHLADRDIAIVQRNERPSTPLTPFITFILQSREIIHRIAKTCHSTFRFPIKNQSAWWLQIHKNGRKRTNSATQKNVRVPIDRTVAMTFASGDSTRVAEQSDVHEERIFIFGSSATKPPMHIRNSGRYCQSRQTFEMEYNHHQHQRIDTRATLRVHPDGLIQY
jgi:hypothetical protein